MNKDLFIRHRREFIQKMEDRSFALFFSGEAPHRSADDYYPYCPNRNFYFLTGLDRPNFTLAFIKNNGSAHEFLFIEEATDYSEKWLGHRLTREEVAAISGFDLSQIQFIANFEGFVASAILSNSRKALTKTPHYLYLDLYRHQPRVKPVAMAKAAFVLDNYPEITVQNANEILDIQRMTKDEGEVQEILKAVGYAKIGLETMWKTVRPGMNEHALDALFEYASKTAGSDGVSFTTIIASGANATTLHYHENNCLIEDGTLVLTDLGCLAGPYASDITRTIPANGKFTQRQKELYNLVLEVNKKSIEFVKPGLMWSDLNAYAKKLLAEGAVKLGVIASEADVDKVYYHTVSHFLGLDVHDVGTYQIPLKEGIVLTIEPGIYIADEKIGIRIEDNVLVTKDGAINLSKDILKEVVDIERAMKR